MLNQKKFYILTLSLIGFTKPIKNYGAEYRTFTDNTNAGNKEINC